MKIKICGIKFKENLEAIASFYPDYLGFIFYPKSKRFMAETLQPEDLVNIPESISKVGVFVNEGVDQIIEIIEYYHLDAIQLHGDESPEYIMELKTKLGIYKLNTQNSNPMQLKANSSQLTTIIKAFGIHKEFDFKSLNNYKDHCDYFLFDTKTANYGGSGEQFDWEVLNQYKLDTPVFLSGGIDVEDLDEVLALKNDALFAVDLNSKLELEPGLKDISKVKRAIEKAR